MGKLAKSGAALLFTILLLAVFLRAYHLGTESLWTDEAATLQFISMESPSEIVEGSKADRNFPTYYLILHYWVALFGDSEVSLRLPSALAGVLAVLAMYKVGYLLFGRSVGFMASLILALSTFHIRYSQEARVYSLMVLLTLLSFYFFVKLLSDRKLGTRAKYVLCTIALMYSHVYGLFIVLAQNVYFAAIFVGVTLSSRGEARLRLREWGALQALLFVLFLPGFMLMLGWMTAMGSWGGTPPSVDSVYEGLVQYAGSPLLLALLLAFSMIAIVALVRSGGTNKLYLLAAWFLTPVALPIALSHFITSIWGTRYGIAGSLALYLLAAKGVEVASDAFSRGFLQRIPKASKFRTVWLILAAVLIVLFSRELWSYFNTVAKPQWREVAQYVDTHAQNDDLVLIEGYREHETIFNYYSDRIDIETNSTSSLGSGEPESFSVEAVGPIVEAHDRVWGVRPPVSKRSEKLRLEESVYDEGHTPVDYKQYKQIDLTLYEKR